jgi:branched-chain amino acid transport system substrate-binding protein
MISPGATNPELTQRGYQYIMRTAGLDSAGADRRQIHPRK